MDGLIALMARARVERVRLAETTLMPCVSICVH
jgi:hypothetical protein